MAASVKEKALQVQLVQFNNAYGNQLYLPYSVGLLQAYVQQFPELSGHVQFKPFVYQRVEVEKIVAQIGQVDLLAFSCSIWNWNLSMAVAAAIRAKYPRTYILVGGPHVPFTTVMGEFFSNWPFLDMACYGEGEAAFAGVVRALIEGQVPSDVPGISFHDRNTGQVVIREPAPRILDLDQIASPYLNGTFDSLFAEQREVSWMALWETNRGCPYSCSFCEWGGIDTNKVRRFSESRLKEEIEWFGNRKIGYLFGCDSNYGLLRRDGDLVDELVAAKKRHGFPDKFRVCFAKNSSDRVIDIAQALKEADMLKGLGLSFQSLHQETLKAIRRENMGIEFYRKLQERCTNSNIPTYSELVVALPCETYETYVAGIDTLIDNGQHSGLNIYNCTVLPSSEIGSPEYQKKFGLQVVEIPIFQEHSAKRTAADNVVEKESIVVGSSAASIEDWREMHRFSWAVLCFHYLGMLQFVAIFLRNFYGISYKDYYQSLVNYGRERPDSLIGQELQSLDEILSNVLSGIGFDKFVPEFEQISWPYEEAAFLKFSEQKGQFFREAKESTDHLLHSRGQPFDATLIEQLFHYQFHVVKHYDDDDDKELLVRLDYNLPECITGYKSGNPIELVDGAFSYKVNVKAGARGDKVKFSREVVWFGRKGGTYCYTVTPVSHGVAGA
ncbi:MAG: radical SAM protein [Magnetococcales bacterium]|nr:radical SAM protein [Magnetococcales bacterium]